MESNEENCPHLVWTNDSITTCVVGCCLFKATHVAVGCNCLKTIALPIGSYVLSVPCTLLSQRLWHAFCFNPGRLAVPEATIVFDKNRNCLVRYVVSVSLVIAMTGLLGCSVQSSGDVSEEDAAALGAEFGRIWVKPGAELYTLEFDDAHPNGRLEHSRTVEKGGFVALIGYTNEGAIQGSCAAFEHGLAAVELTNEDFSPTFFVDKQQLLGITLATHDPKGIGIRTESVLETSTLDNCGSIVQVPVQITNTALLRPVVDSHGAVLPVYLDVTSVAPLRFVQATDDVEALGTCVPEAFWDSPWGRALIEADGNNYLGPNSPGDECRQEGQDGYFVRLTQGDASRLISTDAFAELQSVAFAGTTYDAGGSRGSGLGRAVVILGLGALAVVAGYVGLKSLAPPHVNLPAPEVGPVVAFTQGVSTVTEAGVTTYTAHVSPNGYSQYYRYTCVAVCAESFASNPLSGRDTTVIRTKEVTSVESLRVQLTNTFPQNEQALFALGSSNQLDPAKINAINNLQKAYLAATNGVACSNPVVPMCVFTTY